MKDVPKAIEAVWKIESTPLIAAIARVTHDTGIVEERPGCALSATGIATIEERSHVTWTSLTSRCSSPTRFGAVLEVGVAEAAVRALAAARGARSVSVRPTNRHRSWASANTV